MITRLGALASFETVAAETKKVEGIAVPVATPLALYRLKRRTVRAASERPLSGPFHRTPAVSAFGTLQVGEEMRDGRVVSIYRTADFLGVNGELVR